MGNKNRNRGNRGNNQGNNNHKNHQQTPVERIKFLYEKSRQRNDIEVLVNDSLVKSNPRIIVELSSEFVEPVLGMGLMTDLIDSETQTLCARMVLQAIKDFRSFNNDEDSLTRIFNRIASDAVNNQEFEGLGDDLFTAIQAEFPDVTDADAMRLAIYVFINSTIKSVLGISDDIQTEEDENIEVSASTSTAEPETTDDQKESQEQISTEETPLLEHKEEGTEKNPVIDVEYREVETSKSDSSNSGNDESSDSKTDFEVAVMTRLEELSELAVKEALPIVKDFCEKSEAVTTNNDMYDTIKSVSISQLSMSWSPDELLKGEAENLLSKIETELFAQVCGKITEMSLRSQIQKAKQEATKMEPETAVEMKVETPRPKSQINQTNEITFAASNLNQKVEYDSTHTSPNVCKKPTSISYKYGNKHADAFMRFMGAY